MLFGRLFVLFSFLLNLGAWADCGSQSASPDDFASAPLPASCVGIGGDDALFCKATYYVSQLPKTHRVADFENCHGKAINLSRTYTLKKTVQVPRGISVVGVGGAAILQSTASPVVSIVNFSGEKGYYSAIATGISSGNTFGLLSNFIISCKGEGNSSIGLYLAPQALQRLFSNISIDGCGEAGVVLEGSQNNSFENINVSNSKVGIGIYDSASAGMGAGNNNFVRFEINMGPNSTVGFEIANRQGFNPFSNHIEKGAIECNYSGTDHLPCAKGKYGIRIYKGTDNSFNHINVATNSPGTLAQVSVAGNGGMNQFNDIQFYSYTGAVDFYVDPGAMATILQNSFFRYAGNDGKTNHPAIKIDGAASVLEKIFFTSQEHDQIFFRNQAANPPTSFVLKCLSPTNCR